MLILGKDDKLALDTHFWGISHLLLFSIFLMKTVRHFYCFSFGTKSQIVDVRENCNAKELVHDGIDTSNLCNEGLLFTSYPQKKKKH